MKEYKPTKKLKKKIAILGFPMDLGAGRRGVDMGPSALRYANLEEKLEELGYKVKDFGDLFIEGAETLTIRNHKLKYLPEIVRSSKILAKKIESLLIEAVNLLAADEPLPVRYSDHALAGEWKDHRDCHIRPDMVLIYRKPDDTDATERVVVANADQLYLLVPCLCTNFKHDAQPFGSSENAT